MKFTVNNDMKPLEILCLSVLILITACGSPTDSGMTKKKTITSEVAQETKASTTSLSREAEDESEVVVIPKDQLIKAEEIITSVTAEELGLLDSKLLFKQNCSICHGMKGNMKINGAKDLTKSRTTLVKSVAQVYFGRRLMTPFKGKLTDAEIVATSQYALDLGKK